jgi:tryptophan-rich sensory protein
MSALGMKTRPVLVAAFAAILVAILGGTITELGPWYQSLERPAWQPPDWLFGPVWTTIFALAALSAATAWQNAPTRAARDWIVILFSLNGFLNLLWSFLFFRMHRPDWALVEVGLLFLSILLLMFSLSRISRLSSLLLAPYLLWVGFAAALNWKVVQLNGPF